MTEKFTCAYCEAVNTIIWDPSEWSRVIPCTGCYYEETVMVEGQAKVVVHGNKITAHRSKGN